MIASCQDVRSFSDYDRFVKATTTPKDTTLERQVNNYLWVSWSIFCVFYIEHCTAIIVLDTQPHYFVLRSISDTIFHQRNRYECRLSCALEHCGARTFWSFDKLCPDLSNDTKVAVRSSWKWSYLGKQAAVGQRVWLVSGERVELTGQ